MVRFLKKMVNNERGQTLPLVLALMVLGGLMIVPGLSYTATSIDSGRTIETSVDGIYAADAGVEYALWCLQNSMPPPEQLPENVNQMPVAIQTDDRGTYTLCLGELVQAGHHSSYLSVSGEMVWDGGADAYKYTITVRREGGSPTIHLTEVGARLPEGYSYQDGSAALFADNLSFDEPDMFTDGYGAYMLNWGFEEPYPAVTVTEPERTQTFYISGEESTEGHYAWVVANRGDVGEVGEISGELYQITATATEDGEITAKIIADVMIDGATIYLAAWQVLSD